MRLIQESLCHFVRSIAGGAKVSHQLLVSPGEATIGATIHQVISPRRILGFKHIIRIVGEDNFADSCVRV